MAGLLRSLPRCLCAIRQAGKTRGVDTTSLFPLFHHRRIVLGLVKHGYRMQLEANPAHNTHLRTLHGTSTLSSIPLLRRPLEPMPCRCRACQAKWTGAVRRRQGMATRQQLLHLLPRLRNTNHVRRSLKYFATCEPHRAAMGQKVAHQLLT
jgi:hypothetical protein